MLTTILLLILGLHDGTVPAARTAAPVKVVTSLTTYAAIATEIVGGLPRRAVALCEGGKPPSLSSPKSLMI